MLEIKDLHASINGKEILKGIDLTNFVDNGIDEQKGIRTYSAILGLSVFASATNSTIYLQGVVSRELNGSFETKTDLGICLTGW